MNMSSKFPETARVFRQAAAIAIVGPYDTLYASRTDNILWGPHPSHLVERAIAERRPGVVLDVGCGDGVNALALEFAGFSLTGVDISSVALAGLRNRFARASAPLNGRYLHADIRTLDLSTEMRSFDVIVSCGLFHCLERGGRVEAHRRLFKCLKAGGLILFSCLTEDTPLPLDHGTDGLDLASHDEIEQLFSGCDITSDERREIEDEHFPVVSHHRHSARWISATQF